MAAILFYSAGSRSLVIPLLLLLGPCGNLYGHFLFWLLLRKALVTSSWLPLSPIFYKQDFASKTITGYQAFPRAETGQTASTCPFLTQTYQSCRLQVGSQWPGIRRSLSLMASLFCLSVMTPCSSEQVV